MLKQITKVGNSQGLILDSALMELTGLRVGDQVNISVAPRRRHRTYADTQGFAA